MKVLSVVGHKDSGKTTLIEELVARLSETSRVATIKSIHHDIEVDTPDTDTHRHQMAGAETVVGVTPSHSFTIGTWGRSDPDFLVETLESLERDGYDYVLVEGFKQSGLPVIVLGDLDAAEFSGRCLERYPEASSPDIGALLALVSAMDHWSTARA